MDAFPKPRPNLYRSRAGLWWVYLDQRRFPDYVQTRGVNPDSRQFESEWENRSELHPAFRWWLEANDPGYHARSNYGTLVLTFGSENGAMLFRLMTDATITWHGP